MKKVSIDNNLTENFEPVQMMTNTPVVADAPEEVSLEVTDYNLLDKETLISLHKTKDSTIENYQTVLERNEEERKKEIDSLTNYYREKITEQDNVIRYYERKLKLINDLIHIETGGVK
jgi:hypothetical protein